MLLDLSITKIPVVRVAATVAYTICLGFTSPASADCALSNDDKTKICTGDITSGESFVNDSITSATSYTFTIEDLTSGEASTGGDYLFQFATTGADSDSGNGHAGGGLNFNLNVDQAASDYSVHARAGTAISITSTGGTGHTPDEESGDDDQNGGDGGAGGAGGAIDASISQSTLNGTTYAFQALSSGANGAEGGEGYAKEFGDGRGGTGGAGGAGGAISLNFSDVAILGTGSTGPAAFATSSGGDGGTGGTGKALDYTAFGGTGGEGGEGGDVSTSFSNGLTVTADADGGLHLFSEGGAGGTGGYAEDEGGAGTAKGGTGGEGGSAGTVTLTASDDSSLSISSTDGYGIWMESKAGAGGTGGRATAAASLDPGDPGKGGAGGAGGDVVFALDQNDLTIKNTGSEEYGLVARSFGGDGGDAGDRGTSTSGNGGAGGNGGEAGDVSIQLNAAADVTTKITADGTGIQAEAVGGNGSNGNEGGTDYDGGDGGNGGAGGSISTGAGSVVNITAASGIVFNSEGGDGGDAGDGDNRGGRGGAAGDGGTLELDYVDGDTYGGWSITATGDGGTGISLTSTGGNAGYGGDTNVADAFPGGDGGDGGEIIAHTQAMRTITTTGDNSYAFYATSIAGEGGNGGKTTGDGLAGDAGNGGAGNKILVSGAWDVQTSGTDAYGIWAKNRGGRGGNGGEGNVLNFSNPGTAGAGGDAGLVQLQFTKEASTLTLKSSGSTGVYLESLGGMGGESGTNGFGEVKSNSGGVGGAAGDVYVAAYEDVTVTSTLNGIIAESTGGAGNLGQDMPWADLGGPGGIGGVGGTLALNENSDGDLGTGNWTVTISEASGVGIDLTSTGGKGGKGGNTGQTRAGDGGWGGEGGTVDINDGDYTITATGSSSIALRATSQGGAGGVGGTYSCCSEVYGGTGGRGGAAGTVSFDGDWTLTAKESASQGLILESLGGAGGTGGQTNSVKVDEADGGTGGKGGIGGVVTTIDTTSVVINSGGIGATIRSIGGSGGDGGANPKFNGNGPYGTSGGDGGNGGNVTVDGAWQISTTGDGATGMLLESIGGDGGKKVDGSLDPTNGLGGTPGVITFNATAIGGEPIIHTKGASANGLSAIVQSGEFAASAGLDSTLIDLTINGDITASGSGSNAIYAESSGNTYGNITVDVTEGAVVSGGIESDDSGAGVYVLGGNQNQLSNYGTITSVDGADGVGVIYDNTTNGILTVNNYGTIEGEILRLSDDEDLLSTTSGEIQLNNAGIVNAGARLHTDIFRNSGSLFIQDGRIGSTTIYGDLKQTAKGEIVFDYDPSKTAGDLQSDDLVVTGDARLRGQFRARPTSSVQSAKGRQFIKLSEVYGDLDADDLELAASVVGQYELHVDTHEVGLSYDIDFSNRGILSAVNSNQQSVSHHMQALYRDGVLGEDEMAALLEIEDVSEYRAVVNTLGAELAIDNRISSLTASQVFSDTLLSCARREGTYRFLELGDCNWFNVDASRLSYDPGSDSTGFDADSVLLSGGLHRRMDNGWIIGAGFGYQSTNLSVGDSNASSDGNQFFAGLSAKRLVGPWELSGGLSFGYGEFDLDRNPFPNVSIEGNQDVRSVGGLFRVARQFDLGRWMIKPRLDVGIDYISSSSDAEQDASGFGHILEDSDETFFHVTPGVDFATEFTNDTGTLFRPQFGLGVVQYIGDTSVTSNGRFNSAPVGSGFASSTELSKTRVQGHVGLDVFASERSVFRAELAGEFADDYQGYSGSLTYQIRF